jgi:hypothetical protein
VIARTVKGLVDASVDVSVGVHFDEMRVDTPRVLSRSMIIGRSVTTVEARDYEPRCLSIDQVDGAEEIVLDTRSDCYMLYGLVQVE